MSQFKKNFIYFSQLLVLLSSVFGSLYFSEIMKFAPCELCWYQRIALYPLLLILVTGQVLNLKETAYFKLPLIVLGSGLAAYHNLVYYKVIQVFTPCSETAPCTAQHINYLGFISIPLLSLLAFLFLLLTTAAELKLNFKKSY